MKPIDWKDFRQYAREVMRLNEVQVTQFMNSIEKAYEMGRQDEKSKHQRTWEGHIGK